MISDADILLVFYYIKEVDMANDYIKNSDFEKTITAFQEAKEAGDTEKIAELEERLTELFYLLADNILRAFKFQLIDRDDALQEGVMICFERLDKFKPERGKAFNYYTTCTLNHYRHLYRTAKNYNELKKRFHEHMIDTFEEVFMNNVNNQSRAVYRKKHDEV